MAASLVRPSKALTVLLLLVGVSVGWNAGCAAGDDDAEGSDAQRALLLRPGHPEWSAPSPPVWRARFETSQGSFLVEAERERAPRGSDRFYNLIRLGYYDDTRFHRVREGYIVQFGLHGDPDVNRAWLDAHIADDPPAGPNARGTLAFAMTPEPHTRNTQVFINLADNPQLDEEPFSVFGRVIEGMEVLDRLYAGYGEESGSGVRQGRQGPIVEGGNAYLDREFPRLDRIHRVRIEEE
jgi:cyclophilin family peptidyl-prolyl cis-trans isomerase